MHSIHNEKAEEKRYLSYKTGRMIIVQHFYENYFTVIIFQVNKKYQHFIW